jgi:hypothetical protein
MLSDGFAAAAWRDDAAGIARRGTAIAAGRSQLAFGR